MGIKATSSKEKKGDKTFPRLMETRDGLLILATQNNDTEDWLIGAVIFSPDSRWSIGDWDDEWIASLFHDYEGSVTLENK